jgi:hypothetical protein
MDKFALSVGETFENDSWRIHRYQDALRVTYIVKAGKRGGRCPEFVLSSVPAMESTAMEFVMLAKRGSDYNRMKKAVEEAKETGADVHESLLKGVDVKPGNFQKLVVRGIHLTVEADYDSYSVQDIDDENNLPTCIARGKRSVFQFYRWVKDNAKAIQTMSMSGAMDAMKEAGIDFHYFCAMD